MANENDLKVAFLYNFALYTEWPMPLVDGLTICVLGRDDLGPALNALANRQIGGKPIIVRRLLAGEFYANTGACHMTYGVTAREEESGKASLDLRQKPVLRVADAASAEWAMISLARDGNRLVFDIDNTHVRASGLVLSSKLLRLARSVR